MAIDWSGMDPKEREEALAGAFRWVREDNGGRLPFGAYQERVKTWHTPFVDVAVVKRRGYDRETVQLLLERRPETGHLYPGMRDVPGGNLNNRELLRDSARRLVAKLGFLWEPLPAGVATYTQTSAEVGVSHLFVVEIGEEWPDPLPEHCSTFLLDRLPKDLVPWQAALYPNMIQRFFSRGPSVLLEYDGQ